jgi:hypothetical protein
MYLYMKLEKMRPVEIIPWMGGGGIKGNYAVNLTIIYCKKFCKCLSITPLQQ